jgi:hypothetical protein
MFYTPKNLSHEASNDTGGWQRRIRHCRWYNLGGRTGDIFDEPKWAHIAHQESMVGTGENDPDSDPDPDSVRLVPPCKTIDNSYTLSQIALIHWKPTIDACPSLSQANCCPKPVMIVLL